MRREVFVFTVAHGIPSHHRGTIFVKLSEYFRRLTLDLPLFHYFIILLCFLFASRNFVMLFLVVYPVVIVGCKRGSTKCVENRKIRKLAQY